MYLAVEPHNVLKMPEKLQELLGFSVIPVSLVNRDGAIACPRNDMHVVGLAYCMLTVAVSAWNGVAVRQPFLGYVDGRHPLKAVRRLADRRGIETANHSRL